MERRLERAREKGIFVFIIPRYLIFEEKPRGEGKTLTITMLVEGAIVVSLIVGAAAVCIVVFGVQTYMVFTGKISDKDPPRHDASPYHGLLPVF